MQKIVKGLFIFNLIVCAICLIGNISIMSSQVNSNNVNGNSNIAVSGITLNVNSYTLNIGEYTILTATISPTSATNKDITWKTSNQNIATISNAYPGCKVLAIGIGTTTITATSSNGKVAYCTIKVIENIPIQSISLNKSNTTLYVGDTETLNASVYPSNATNPVLSWSSSNTNVATINNGVITAKTIGTSTITVSTNNGKTCICNVTVKTATNYSIIYNLNGGTNSSSNPNTFNEKTQNFSLYAPTKNGYTFLGWTGSNGSTPQANVTINKGSSGNKTYTANWTLTTYTISYNYNGWSGDINNPTTYNFESKTITLNIPESVAEFKGWKTQHGEIINTIPQGSTGNLFLTAQWPEELIDYTYSLTSTDCIILSLRNKNISQLLIPDYVTSIGSSAFSGCGGLTSITIPNSVTSIGRSAFSGCSILKEITLPFVGSSLNDTSNTHFGYIFGTSSYSRNSNYVPSSLKEVTITGGSSIDAHAFSDCGRLTNITIPSSVTSIGEDAFYYCWSLTSITFAENSQLTSIGNQAFSQCSNLTSITIPNSVTSIGSYAFSGCYSLTSITIPNSVISIDMGAFSGCRHLTSITIPSSVTNIGDRAFSGCYSLTSITIPSSVTNIGDGAFYYCRALAEVYNLSDLPIIIGQTDNGRVGYYAKVIHTSASIASRIKIENNIAYYVGDNEKIALTVLDKTKKSIILANDCTSINQYVFFDCWSLISVTFESDSKLTSIGTYAFSGCSSLTSIEIPSSVTSIGNQAFSGCHSLTSVIFENPNGWKAGEKISLSSSSLSNESTAATYLKTTYCGYTWTRS